MYTYMVSEIEIINVHVISYDSRRYRQMVVAELLNIPWIYKRSIYLEPSEIHALGELKRSD